MHFGVAQLVEPTRRPQDNVLSNHARQRLRTNAVGNEVLLSQCASIFEKIEGASLLSLLGRHEM